LGAASMMVDSNVTLPWMGVPA